MIQENGEEKETSAQAGGSDSVRVIDKALGVLELMSQLDEDIDLAGLTKMTGIPKTTLLRLLNSLKKHNFIQLNSRSKRYHLGWALIYLGKKAGKVFNLPSIIHPFLEKLTEESGETSSLVLLDNSHAVYIDQVVSKKMIKGMPEVGSSVQLYCSASGKVLLCSFDDAKLKSYFDNVDIQKFTEKTITDAGALKIELERVREQGYAVDDGEVDLGGRCIAAPIFNKEEKIVAALSISGPVSRITNENLNDLVSIVQKLANDASTALGSKQHIY